MNGQAQVALHDFTAAGISKAERFRGVIRQSQFCTNDAIAKD